jgi:ABC-type phosphate/phosphonate transport system substrate-binding protein
VGLLLVPLTLPVPAEDLVNRNPKIRVGVAVSLFRDAPAPLHDGPAPLVSGLLKTFKSLLDAQTGINGQMVVADDAADLGKQLADDKVQLGVFHGFEFAWARLKHPDLKPLIVMVNSHHCLCAKLVVFKGSSFTKLADLKGKNLAIPVYTGEHCHLFIERRCVAAGDPLDRFFDKIATPPNMEDALDGVIDGIYQAAVVDGEVLANYGQRKPGRYGKLRTLLESEDFPPDVVACNPANLDEQIQKRFSQGLINAAQTSRGKHLLLICRVNGFEMIPANYDKALKDIAKRYPPPAPASEN